MKKNLRMFMVTGLLGGVLLVGGILTQARGVNENLSNQMHVVVQVKTVQGVKMVPLREVSEKLGFDVVWNDKEKTITLDDGIMNTVLTLGVDSYYASSVVAIGMSAPQSLGMGPVVIEGKTYVPAEMFCALLGNTKGAVVIDKGVANFTKILEINEENLQIPNPYTEHDSLEALQEAVSFKVVVPTKLPVGYQLSQMYDISHKVAEVRWTKGESDISYRVAKYQAEQEDISGDYTVYDEVTIDQVGENRVIFKGKENQIYVATWTNGKYAFSISVNPLEEGIEKGVMIDMITSIR